MNQLNRTLLFFLILSTRISAQWIEVDSIISENKITPYQNQNLIMIDFWATWCTPCIPATKQLEILQETYSNDIYIISLSDESNQKISNFLKDKPIKLSVVSDFKSENVRKYRVEGRPYAILFNKNGNKLWEGKPGDFTVSVLNQYTRSQSKKTNTKTQISEIIRTRDSIKGSITKDSSTNSSYQEIAIDYKTIQSNKSYNFVGTLKQFISEYKHIPLMLIDDNSNSLTPIGIKFPEYYLKNIAESNLADSVLKHLNISLFTTEISYKVYELIITDTSKLWDKNQIEWDENSPKFLVGDISLEANNVSLRKLAVQLSNLKNEIYQYNGSNEELYDFNFIHSVPQMMLEDLKNTFGINISTQVKSISRYNFEVLEYKKSTITID